MSIIFHKRLSRLSVDEIREILDSNEITPEILKKLDGDSRVSVKNLAKSIRGKIERDNSCQVKMEDLRRLENKIVLSGKSPVCGLDEAGRGPLAGPVVSAAVILPENLDIPGLDDSKKLKASERERLYKIITAEAVAWDVGIVDNIDIDRMGILQAALQSMRIAFGKLKVRPVVALVDGNQTPRLNIEERLIISGDSKCRSIAAASIIAKVTRDRIMQEIELVYPGYGFGNHKGYGSVEHYDSLKKIGPCAIHRFSFRTVPEVSPGEISLKILKERITSCETEEELKRAALSISRIKHCLSITQIEILRETYTEHNKSLSSKNKISDEDLIL